MKNVERKLILFIALFVIILSGCSKHVSTTTFTGRIIKVYADSVLIETDEQVKFECAVIYINKCSHDFDIKEGQNIKFEVKDVISSTYPVEAVAKTMTLVGDI